jgi:hypothetical protein
LVKNKNYEATHCHFPHPVVDDNSNDCNYNDDDDDNSNNNNNNNNNTTVTFKDCNKRKNLFASRINAAGMCNVKAYTISIYLTITFLKSLALVSKPGTTPPEKFVSA